MSTRLVRDVMSAVPVSLPPATPVNELLARFDRHDFNAFPVVDDGGRLVGVVSKLDVLRLSLGPEAGRTRQAPDLAHELVANFMSRELVTVAPDDPLDVAGRRMVEARLHSLPVIEQREDARFLVGIVSRGDLLRALRFRLAEAGARRGDGAP